VDEGAGEKPAQPLNVGGEARHQISGFILVKEGLGKTKRPFEEIMLDIQDDLLLKAGKIKFLQGMHQFFSERDSQEKKNGDGKKAELTP
jgi:hypothetical protein